MNIGIDVDGVLMDDDTYYKTQERSSIGEQMRKDTVDWLNKNNIIYDEICYTHCPKTKEIKEKNIDFFIKCT